MVVPSANLRSLPSLSLSSPISVSSSINPKPPIQPKPFPLSNDNHSPVSSSEPMRSLETAIKMSTAPWIKGPLLLQPDEVSNASKAKKKKKKNSTGDAEPEKVDRVLSEKVAGARGTKAMNAIVKNIAKLHGIRNSETTQKNSGEFQLGFSWVGIKSEEEMKIGPKMPWSRPEAVVFCKERKEKTMMAAEQALDRELLERLRDEAREMRRWVKVKKAGVTQVVVDEIRLIWRRNELAMLKFDLPLSRNMVRAREIVEIKTGGLVVWSKKDTIVVYRGSSFPSTSKASLSMLPDLTKDAGEEDSSSVGLYMGKSLYEREADRLLDGLGPRFIDWWRLKPLPVDADLLPEVASGFRPPFRLCPPDVRPKLTDDELTYLRQLARPLPTHFVLGRNRKLQGLAAAILKLWEKCNIVKIALKWGIPNTDNKQMAYELKLLTGGVLLLRNKFYIIMYRGKDFLPSSVANVIADRELELETCETHEEAARFKTNGMFHPTDKPLTISSTSGTLSEFQIIYEQYGDLQNENWKAKLSLEAEKERLKSELRRQEHKLFILKMKIQKSAKVLLKLNSSWQPAEEDLDQEMITDEERECFRKIALKMDGSLLLGRRGIFDGVIEGLHQHWKHREVVKVVTMQKLLSQVIYTARSLEAESGGVLVSVEKLNEGHAIIIYRGKNYRRPLKLVRGNLLTKRAALCKSLEMQRIGSLKFFAYQRHKTISELREKLEKWASSAGKSCRQEICNKLAWIRTVELLMVGLQT